MTTRMNGLYVAVFALTLSLAPSQVRAQVPCVNINDPAATAVQAIRAQLDNVGATTDALGQLITNPSGNTPQGLLSALQASVNGTAGLVNAMQIFTNQVGGSTLPVAVNSLQNSLATFLSLTSFLGTVATVSSLPLPPVSFPIPSIPGIPNLPGSIGLPLPGNLPLPSPFDPATLSAITAQLIATQQQINTIIPTICQ